jgi:alanine racemase
LADSWVEVDLDRIASNWSILGQRLPPGCGFMGVVKSEAYGHGLVPVAGLLTRLGVDWLGVAHAEEGLAIRDAGIETPVLILSGFLPGAEGELLRRNLTPACHSIEQLEMLALAARRLEIQARLHLKINTGMNRLGVLPRDLGRVLNILQRHPELRLEGVLSHFACADQPRHPLNRLQRQRFSRALARVRKAGLRPRWSHLANSAALLHFPQTCLDLVRVGLLLYGVPPRGASLPAGMRPALSWKARVLAVRELGRGEPLGYGARFVASRRMRIGILPVGYGDGYSWRLGGRGAVLLRGSRAAVLEAVSMNLVAFDASELPDLRIGEEVTLLGESGSAAVGAAELARRAGTIPYDILCATQRGASRTYRGGA